MSSLNAALSFSASTRIGEAGLCMMSTGIVEEVTEEDALPSSAARVLGLFSDAPHGGRESAEFEVRGERTAIEHDVYFARVDDPQISQALIDAGFADRTPAASS